MQALASVQLEVNGVGPDVDLLKDKTGFAVKQWYTCPRCKEST
jgi:hypothetical protein